MAGLGVAISTRRTEVGADSFLAEIHLEYMARVTILTGGVHAKSCRSEQRIGATNPRQAFQARKPDSNALLDRLRGSFSGEPKGTRAISATLHHVFPKELYLNNLQR